MEAARSSKYKYTYIKSLKKNQGLFSSNYSSIFYFGCLYFLGPFVLQMFWKIKQKAYIGCFGIISIFVSCLISFPQIFATPPRKKSQTFFFQCHNFHVDPTAFFAMTSYNSQPQNLHVLWPGVSLHFLPSFILKHLFSVLSQNVLKMYLIFPPVKHAVTTTVELPLSWVTYFACYEHVDISKWSQNVFAPHPSPISHTVMDPPQYIKLGHMQLFFLLESFYKCLRSFSFWARCKPLASVGVPDFSGLWNTIFSCIQHIPFISSPIPPIYSMHFVLKRSQKEKKTWSLWLWVAAAKDLSHLPILLPAHMRGCWVWAHMPSLTLFSGSGDAHWVTNSHAESGTPCWVSYPLCWLWGPTPYARSICGLITYTHHPLSELCQLMLPLCCHCSPTAKFLDPWGSIFLANIVRINFNQLVRGERHGSYAWKYSRF